MEKQTYLIIGLGNIGEKYAHTRHNAGFEAADRLKEKLGIRLRKGLLMKGAAGEKADDEKRIVLVEPTTLMNRSGECVQQMMQRYGCPPERTLIIYDDIDLPPGRIRVRKSGGAGTHNGMRSIVAVTGSEAFPRIRIGTGDRPAGEDLVEWVLGRPGAEEMPKMEAAYERAAECALLWAEKGIDAAMQEGNKKC